MLDHTRSEKLAGDKYSSLLGAPVSYKEVVNTAPEWTLINFILWGLSREKKWDDSVARRFRGQEMTGANTEGKAVGSFVIQPTVIKLFFTWSAHERILSGVQKRYLANWTSWEPTGASETLQTSCFLSLLSRPAAPEVKSAPKGSRVGRRRTRRRHPSRRFWTQCYKTFYGRNLLSFVIG